MTLYIRTEVDMKQTWAELGAEDGATVSVEVRFCLLQC